MVPTEISAAYATVVHEARALQTRVDSILRAFAEEQDGAYTSRVKAAESVYEKLVLGDYRALDEVEDLFAATIVLPNAPVGEARSLFATALGGHFLVAEVRSDRTRAPMEFIYDDLHFVLRLKDSPLLLNKALLKYRFELQVKSYLQHGWAKAVHNTVYKTPNESWRASRVAAQTKAAVEMVEASLALGAEFLPEDAAQRYEPIDNRVLVCGLLLEWWHGDFPDNRRRLGIFTVNMLRLACINADEFKTLLESVRARELAAMKSLSVHQAIMILLIEARSGAVLQNLQSGRKRYLLITSDMEALSEACRALPAQVRVAVSH